MLRPITAVSAAVLVAGLACAKPEPTPQRQPKVGLRAERVVESSRDLVWSRLRDVSEAERAAEAWIRPAKFEAYALDVAAVRAKLGAAPLESAVRQKRGAPARLSLPTPDGTFQAFDVVEAPVMHPDLQAKFPEIRTYLAQGVDDPAATARITLTPDGVDAQVLTPTGAWYVDRYAKGDDGLYASYHRTDYHNDQPWACEVEDAAGNGLPEPRMEVNALASGAQLRTYRLAVATTGEYTRYHGGSVASGLAAVVTAVNRVTGIYETEVAVRLELVADNDEIIFTNPNSDPFTNNNPYALISQNQSVIDSRIGSANYDIGHNFSTGGGGLASLGVVCEAGWKAEGITGLYAPIGDPFYVDYVAHEMGHQFGAEHSFNGNQGSCTYNRSPGSAYEPGSGSTVMGYAGICGGDNIQGRSDAYFHAVSYDEIRSYVSSPWGGASCGVLTSTGNNPPTVDAGPNLAIPAETPFTLTATGSDPDGDPLTFCWEQWDLGAAKTLAAGDNGSSPLFRSRAPDASPSRTFPQFTTALAGATDIRERLPTRARTMDMRVTVRDNRADGGGVAYDTRTLQVVDTPPFRVTAPASGEGVGAVLPLRWDVSGTNAAPINTSSVRVVLSTDGGSTFPIVLAESTPNDGSEDIRLPSGLDTTRARVMIEAVGNVFFAVSTRNFTVETPCVADFGGNGSTDVSDLLAYLSAFRTADAAADMNGDGSVNVADLLGYLAAFREGC